MNSQDTIESSGETKKRRPRLLLPVAILAAVLFVGTTVFFLVKEINAVALQNDPSGKSLPDYGELPYFQLTERSGTAVSRKDLEGTVWIADFIFTSCSGPCPLMTQRMARIQDRLANQDGVRLVSISVDPERDTPPVLSKYADEYGARPDIWWFLTGRKEAILHVAVDGFHLGSRDDPLLHSTRFVLVDKHGHIRGYYESESPETMTRLLRDVDILRGSSTS